MRSSFARCAALVALVLAPGCTWISDKQVKDRQSTVDNDGDGYPAATDCNDADASVNPGATETWYDGVDQDCAGDDDYDADQDGFVPDAYVGLATGGVASSGALPGGDCNDTDGTIRPGATEIWYDGVDQDCAGDDDYDQDKDGYVPDAYVGLPTAGVSGSGGLSGGDCDDTALGVHPGGVDNWYDGIDSDCAGNDDYDQDGDGFHTDDTTVTYGPTKYVPGSGVLPGGDCSDTDATFYPGAPDDWYDGFDKNCDGHSDWDQDYDGFDAIHGTEGSDCDDRDATVFPGGVELLGDSKDSDCDGQNDRFSLNALPGLVFRDAREPMFAANSTDVYLSVPDTHLTSGAQDYYDSAAAIRWSLSAPHTVAGVQMWNSNTSNPSSFNVGNGQGFTVTDEYIYGVLALDLTGGHGLRFVRFNLSTGSRDGVNVQSTGTAAYSDVSFVYNGSSLLAAGADTDGNLTFARVDDITSSNYDVNHEESQGVSTVAMTLNGSNAIYGSDASELLGFSFDPLGPEAAYSVSTVASDPDVADLDSLDNLGYPEIVEALPDSGIIRMMDVETSAIVDVPASQVVNVAVAQSAATGVWYIAWSDSAGDVHLSFGADLSAMQTLDWDLPGTAAKVACWAAGGTVWMAVEADGVVTVGQVDE